LDIELKNLSGERLKLNLIDENGKRYAPVDRVVVEVMNITKDGSGADKFYLSLLWSLAMMHVIDAVLDSFSDLFRSHR
jgi:hypothetical protein